MTSVQMLRAGLLSAAVLLPSAAHAVFFILPIPNFAKPAPLSSLIDALEKSEETKAVAYASEDKTFGSKYWVWGQFSGHVPQAEADRRAMTQCQQSLANAKAQTAGGKPLYDFGSKTCELHSFTNKTVSPRANEWQPPTATPAPVTAPSVPASPAAPSEPPASTAAAPKAVTPAASSPEQPSSAAVPQQAPAPSSADSPTARKLRELEALRKEGLITEAEYQEKRRAILSAM